MKKWLTLMLLTLSPVALSQVTDLDSLQQQLAKHATVRGEFIQSRHLEMFEQPLSSQGAFTLNKKSGLLWQQTSPFPVSLVLTQDKLRQTFSGQPAQTITAQDNPMAFYFSHVFLAVFHGDTEQLKQQFTISFEATDGDWALELTPKQAPLDAVFEHITLQGDENINRLELQEIRGDKTQIQFSNQTSFPEALTDAEQQQFSF
ncbi:LolA family protein [Vibrio sinaloensis]|uniref:LolA family protein n=1 Tax=Photobacterium sp. (strain ATCC 43367) TaxID=379097 RepID=UPI0035EA37FE